MATARGNRRRDRPGFGARLCVSLLALSVGAALGFWGRGLVVETVAGPDLRVAGVAVTGNDRVDAAELVAAAGLTAGLPLASIDPEQVRASLVEHPWVRAARVTTLPPDHVILAVEERVPIAVAALDTGRRFVDATGTAFATARETDLPVFEGVAEPHANGFHPRFAQALRLLEAAERQELPVPARVSLGRRPESELPAITWRRPGSGELTAVLGGQDPDAGLARLAQAWMADLPALRTTAEVDLRFAYQLILRGELAQGDDENEVDEGHSHSQGG